MGQYSISIRGVGVFSLLMMIALAICAGQSARAEDSAYTEVPDWPIPARTAAGSPAGPWNFGQVAAVATTSGGNILVLHRGAHPIMEFDASGKFLRSWGNGLISEGKVVAVAPGDRAQGASGYSAVYGPAGCYSCGAHSIRVDREGNIWVVDAGAHVVYKMDTQGRVLMRLGTTGVSGTGTSEFNLPTDVAFGPDGEIYVSDGYGNARVMKYARDGKYLLQWGGRGTGPGQFGLPHNLATDSAGNVYVTDRDNRRIQVFDANGTFLNEWTDTGGVSTLFMTEDQHLWAGGILRSLKGEVTASLPGQVGGHGTTVTGEGTVFVAQLSGRVQKFVKR